MTQIKVSSDVAGLFHDQPVFVRFQRLQRPEKPDDQPEGYLVWRGRLSL